MKIKILFVVLAVLMSGFMIVSNAKAAEGTCATAKTICTDMAKDGAGWRSPDGMECWYEGVCDSKPRMRGCCRDLTSAKTPAASTKTPSKTSAPTSSGGTSFTNPLGFSTVEKFLGGILSAVQGIIVVLALVFIVIGAVMILVSAGSSDMVEKGKKAITMALVGLAIGVAAPSLLKQLSIVIGWNAGANGPGLTLSEIAVRVLNFLLGTMGIVALIMLVIGAIMYLTSAGDEDRIDKGKEIFKYSLIGVLMAMASMVLVTQIAQFFTTTPTPTATTAISSAGNAGPSGSVESPVSTAKQSVVSTETAGPAAASDPATGAPATCPVGDFSCIGGNAAYGTVTQADCNDYKAGSVLNATKNDCCVDGDYACLNK